MSSGTSATTATATATATTFAAPPARKNSTVSSSKKGGSAASNKGGAGAAGEEEENEKKKRSSRACDQCRRGKQKCVRTPNEQGEEVGACMSCTTQGVECTFSTTSKKRGPPKGYILEIENRMHRLEALLGGLLNNDDPRAQALLEELVGDIEARELLSRDLASAVAVGRDNAPILKSWQRDTATSVTKREESAAPSSSSSKAPITQRGFDLSNVLSSAGLGGSSGSSSNNSPFANLLAGVSNADSSQQSKSWLEDDDLLGGSDTSPAFSSHAGLDGNTMDFDSLLGGGGGSETFAAGSFETGGGSYASSAFAVPSRPNNGDDNIASGSYSTSPRTNQRRKLEQPAAPTSDRSGRTISPQSTRAGKSNPANLFSLQSRGGGVAAPNSINHTGAAYFNLTSKGADTAASPGAMSSPGAASLSASAGDGMSPNAALAAGANEGAGPLTAGSGTNTPAQDGPMSELADVVGQLSLDENAEVRYHGRSSGLYLISKSARFQNMFWRFPKAGVWPPAEDESNMVKTEEILVRNTDASSVLPDKRTADHLMDLYWIYVHPHLPLLYRSLFVRQYRNTVHGTDDGAPSDGTQQDGGKPSNTNGGKVPTLLLLAVYAVAARYSDTGGARKEGIYWKAGEAYAKKAKELLHEDFGSSRLTTCQALLLLAYREIGCGAMARSWTYVGMAVRMAQDMGLFRDVDRWFLPINCFGYEDKQTRKRVWWSCVAMDRYVSAYIGRPMAIFERDYDVALPAEDEPDEHDIWRPIRPDGTDWSVPPVMQPVSVTPSEEEATAVLLSVRNYPQGVKSNSLSCFNHSASLSVLFSRIIANLYAIRIRVLGQNSETLLAHLDQALASWFLKLPPHLQFSPTSSIGNSASNTSKKVPTPHVLTLHCQFFAALILLHRPFIPAHGQSCANQTFPSHSICTTAAAAISNIVSLYSKTYTLRQAIPFLTYYVFSAGIMHVYNSTYDPALAPTAKMHLSKCMRALQEMEITWPSASRQRELLLGLVDIKDADIDIESTMRDETARMGGNAPTGGNAAFRKKREAESQEVDSKNGSGAATPSGSYVPLPVNRTCGRSGGPASAGFASAQIGQPQPSHPPAPRRSASMSKKRHNSVTAVSMRQQAQQPAGGSSSAAQFADSRLSNSPAGIAPSLSGASVPSSAGFPSVDFTFVSPAAGPHTHLPSVSQPSPAFSNMGAFDFGSFTPPAGQFGTGLSLAQMAQFSQQQGMLQQQQQASPGMFGTNGSGSFDPLSSLAGSADHAHISNILGLSGTGHGAMNIPQLQQQQHYAAFNNDITPTNSVSMHTSPGFGLGQAQQNDIVGAASNAHLGIGGASGNAFGNFTDFLFDPFWQQMQAQHGMGAMLGAGKDASPAGTGGDGTHSTSQSSAPGPKQEEPQSGELTPSSFFGAPVSPGDDWQAYLQSTGNH